MEAADIADLKLFIDHCKSDPSILHNPSLGYFRSYIESLGARIPPPPNSSTHAKISDNGDEGPIESDIDLDETDVVEPDNDPPHMMGDPSIENSEENHDAAQTLKSKAVVALSEGQLDKAISHLTEAVTLNPHSAILYATRGEVFVKLKKPNAAIRDADAALQNNPDSAKAYKVRGMARAILGHWEEAAKDLRIASKLDYDQEVDAVLRKVESNVHKIVAHRRKYELSRKERELKKIELEKKRLAEAQAAHLKSSLKDGQVIAIQSKNEIDTKLNAAAKLKRLVVLYFTATWCGPCRTISPVYSTLAANYPQVVFLKVDIDEAREVASTWNITSVPIFFFIKDRKEMDKVVGADKRSLESKIVQYC
ncbi:TPR repeat-containing thioredoxin TDX [Spinacia oleracea]|uniref:TPR repeat-containing thioredoxin TDX n=1 Tax=Spinacia oleracea TaxID=3562 RepID=A0A9R0IZD9_SPIOL|nr:TPR repeat-containing thioredoxin TDX [Spinacia oleracea]